jgi:hypothetical protein
VGGTAAVPQTSTALRHAWRRLHPRAWVTAPRVAESGHFRANDSQGILATSLTRVSTMSGSSDAGLRDRRRAQLATASAGEAANNVISGDGPEHEHG